MPALIGLIGAWLLRIAGIKILISLLAIFTAHIIISYTLLELQHWLGVLFQAAPGFYSLFQYFGMDVAMATFFNIVITGLSIRYLVKKML